METGNGIQVNADSRANGMSDTLTKRLLLDSLEIRNFRLFRHITLSQLGTVNLIVGKNNSGKSCLLEALYLYAERGSPAVIARLLTERNEGLLRRSSFSRDTEPSISTFSALKYLFTGRQEIIDIDHKIEIGPVIQKDANLSLEIAWFTETRQEDGSRQSTRVYPKSQPSLFATGQDIHSRLNIGWGRTFQHLIPERLLRRPREIDLPRISEPVPNVYISSSGLNNEALSRLWDEITLTPLEGHVVTALRLLYTDIEAINIVGSDSSIERIPKIRVRGSSEPLPLRSLGDGVNHMFGIILALTNAQNGIALIDEIENGLHYSIQYEMWRLIFRLARILNIQIFATTHSWDCIEAFQKAATEDEGQDGMLIRLQRQGEDVVPTLFDERKLAIATRNQIEIR